MSSDNATTINPEAKILHINPPLPSVSWTLKQQARGRLMRCDDLTREQADTIKEKIGTMNAYLSRLLARMNRRKFEHDDRLLKAVCKAGAAIHELNVELHYLSVRHGVAREVKD
jgi:hypothetical protein